MFRNVYHNTGNYKGNWKAGIPFTWAARLHLNEILLISLRNAGQRAPAKSDNFASLYPCSSQEIWFESVNMDCQLIINIICAEKSKLAFPCKNTSPQYLCLKSVKGLLFVLISHCVLQSSRE